MGLAKTPAAPRWARWQRIKPVTIMPTSGTTFGMAPAQHRYCQLGEGIDNPTAFSTGTQARRS